VKIYIVHYHLNPGGVTRIIHSQIKALQNLIPNAVITIVCGHCDGASSFEKKGVKVHTNKCLNYFPVNYTKDELKKCYDTLKKWFRSVFKKSGVIHFHNLNLGKNPVATFVANELLQEGYKIINHAHDFSEDRPVNQTFLAKIIEGYFNVSLKKVMYPDDKNYLFGVLNSFDFKRLTEYGVKEEKIRLWPNPVDLCGSNEGKSNKKTRQKIVQFLHLDPSKKIITYPVRVIRRKNIGEFVLIAQLFAKEANFLVTQPPKNPVEIEHYKKWMNFCRKNDINIVFEAGNKVSFPDLVQASDFCISTSIREGFGMAFMEPWLSGTPIVGRKIPYIIRDLERSGIQFPLLYDALIVNNPKEKKDFKDLDEQEKMDFIYTLKTNTEIKKDFLTINSYLIDIFDAVSVDLIDKNKKIIASEYSLEKFGEKLHGAYKTLVG